MVDFRVADFKSSSGEIYLSSHRRSASHLPKYGNSGIQISAPWLFRDSLVLCSRRLAFKPSQILLARFSASALPRFRKIKINCSMAFCLAFLMGYSSQMDSKMVCISFFEILRNSFSHFEVISL